MKKSKILEIKEKAIQNQTENTTLAILLAVPFFTIEWFARSYDLFTSYPQIDNYIHLFSGLAFAAALTLIYRKNMSFVVKSTALVVIFWEILEVIGDIYIPQSTAHLDIFFFDGIKDMVITFISAVISAHIIRKLKRIN